MSTFFLLFQGKHHGLSFFINGKLPKARLFQQVHALVDAFAQVFGAMGVLAQRYQPSSQGVVAL